MNNKLLSLKNDLVFKSLYGNEKNKDILKSFLESILDIDKSDICDLSITSTELIFDIESGILDLLDINILLTSGEIINVEIQLAPFRYMCERLIYFISKRYISFFEKSEREKKLKRFITITLLEHNYTNNFKVHNIYKFMDNENKIVLTNDFEIHLLELKKLNANYDDLLSLWLRFINSNNSDELLKLTSKNNFIKKAYEELERISEDSSIREIYENREKWLVDQKIIIENAKETGYLAGFKDCKIDIVINMIAKGLDLHIIEEITGFSKEDIIKFKNNL